MFNLMSYVGMSLQAEVCMWTLLGLVRTIFDATLFKVNANLKQVWQMKMPPQLSMSVQRVLRTMVSGLMLVQCFTLYVYLAFYIVLLYPVFLEERPTLVLPWLLLAAIRKLLCELTSLALGLGTCVLLGPGRPACVRFLITKIITIAPAFYIWILVLSYYHALKMATAFKTFPAVMPPSDRDFGLELAVRRRRTKSLFGEDLLRRKIKAGLYTERIMVSKAHPQTHLTFNETIHAIASNNSDDGKEQESVVLLPVSATSNGNDSDLGTYEDCVCNDVAIPRDTDRILEQFVSMSLRIAIYLKTNGTDSSKLLDSLSIILRNRSLGLDCNALTSESLEPPQPIRSSQGRAASYLTDYPQIFMKKTSDIKQQLNVGRQEDNKDTEMKTGGSNDILSSSKASNTFHEQNTFIEFPLCDQTNSHDSSHILSVIEKVSDVRDKIKTPNDPLKNNVSDHLDQSINETKNHSLSYSLPNQNEQFDKYQENANISESNHSQSDA